jgi:NADH-quinone oxidoreductase subunit C
MNPAPEASLPVELESIPVWCRTSGDYPRSGCHCNLCLDIDDLLPTVRLLFDNGYFLEDITAVDVEEGIMLVYHFDRFDVCRRVALRLVVPHAAKSAPSIAAIFSGADWHERECFDFFGILFENHPGLKPLLLPDDLGQHPLMKTKDRRSIYALLPMAQIVDRQPQKS